MSNIDQKTAEFIVDVMDSLATSYDSQSVRVQSERRKIQTRYYELVWSLGFSDASKKSRAEWLIEFLNTIAGDSKETPEDRADGLYQDFLKHLDEDGGEWPEYTGPSR